MCRTKIFDNHKIGKMGRKLVFDDPAFLPRLIDTVTEKSNNGISNTFDKSAKSTPNVPPSALETNGGNNAAAAAAHHTTLNGVSSPQPKHQEDESPSSPSRDQGGNHGVSLSDDLSDSAFETPVQASPGAASELHRAFSVLRDSCAGCSSNQDLLRETGLVDQASFFHDFPDNVALTNRGACYAIRNSGSVDRARGPSDDTVGIPPLLCFAFDRTRVHL